MTVIVWTLRPVSDSHRVDSGLISLGTMKVVVNKIVSLYGCDAEDHCMNQNQETDLVILYCQNELFLFDLFVLAEMRHHTMALFFQNKTMECLRATTTDLVNRAMSVSAASAVSMVKPAGIAQWLERRTRD